MCYCDPSNQFTGKSCGKEKCRPWEYREAMRELTAERDALKAQLRHTRDAFEIGGLIRSDINSICDVLDVTASKLFQIAKGGENER